ncbi:MAG: quinone-dependent dihydroorotate dehydrogenase [Fimbriimonadaceae bacterium]|nr:quinone-dependent dihydroorotate dehydrogenase [Fimbriimonadaceae bacterium]
MGAYDRLVRPLLFRLDPERVHEWAFSLLERGWIRATVYRHSILEQTLFGVRFSNPLGLAAGFDKDARAVSAWRGLGFGFAEVGTVTPRPQPGNPRPRLFRLPEDGAIVNRMGFNNQGATAMAARLCAARPGLPIGINLGKNKDTPLAEAAGDYAAAFSLLRNHGDYFVVNVSSPNTPGLRTLQDRSSLLEIVKAVQSVDATKPLFVKVAPDLEPSALEDAAAVIDEANLTGVIATNTTLSRVGLCRDPNEAGGLSGRPLRDRSDEVLRSLAGLLPNRTLIGVGGVFGGEDVYRKLRLGASLVQVYTGWVYGGPSSAPRMLRELAALLERDGIRSLEEARRSALPKA